MAAAVRETLGKMIPDEMHGARTRGAARALLTRRDRLRRVRSVEAVQNGTEEVPSADCPGLERLQGGHRNRLGWVASSSVESEPSFRRARRPLRDDGAGRRLRRRRWRPAVAVRGSAAPVRPCPEGCEGHGHVVR